jgi:hypothetical protein
MKAVLLAFFILATCTSVLAQGVIKQQSCSDTFINAQVDSLKTVFEKANFTLLREASISMESDFEMPVVMPLTEGSWYQFVFIGDNTSRLYEVRMYDWSEQMVVFRQNRWADVDGNVIAYSYIPKRSEFHMMKPVQINKKKKKGLCGYVMLFRKNVADEKRGQAVSDQ